MKPTIIRSAGFGGSAKSKPRGMDFHRASKAEEQEEEEEEEEEGPAVEAEFMETDLAETPEEIAMRASFPSSFGKGVKKATTQPMEAIHQQTHRKEPPKPKKKGKLMMSIGPIKSLGSNLVSASAPTPDSPAPNDPTPVGSIGSIAHRETPAPRSPGHDPSGSGGSADALGAGADANSRARIHAKDHSSEVAGPVPEPSVASMAVPEGKTGGNEEV
eukprot:CAMPEP_0198207908 /NCGR_PEP_ID=MMETSP1445-20131203/11320_1 /TAXON_ID=36898 /ORGANISM="Pyramimonas sp., Strain CCMP2087" /LENGTH=215 /DNA_ID=CAMNT_0043881093 /DNA_START=130 /DNA_END=773 /DNA_ORIENTATION=-